MNFKSIKDILRYHKIDWYALQRSTTRKNRLSKNKIKCVAGPLEFEFLIELQKHVKIGNKEFAFVWSISFM